MDIMILLGDIFILLLEDIFTLLVFIPYVSDFFLKTCNSATIIHVECTQSTEISGMSGVAHISKTRLCLSLSV